MANTPAFHGLDGSQQVALLKDLAEALNEATDVNSATAAILPRLGEVLGLKTAWAFRYDSQRGAFVEVGSSGLPPALSDHDAQALKNSWCECQERLVRGRMHTAVNIVRCSRLRDAVGEKNQLVFHASIPLRTHTKLLGILNVAAPGSRVFTPAALNLLRTIGFQVAVAVDRAAVLSDEQHYAQRLNQLQVFAQALTTLTTPLEILEYAVKGLVTHLGFEAAAIDEVQLGVAREISRAEQPPYSGPEYSYLDTNREPPPAGRVLPLAPSQLSLEVPLTPYRIQVESTLWNAFSSLDANILSAFGGHLAAALENARLHAQSRIEAQWEERRRLAAELHDSVSQRLFSAQLLCRAAEVKSDDPAIQALLSQVAVLVQESQWALRTLVKTLRPLERRSLETQLEDTVSRVSEALGQKVTLHLDAQLDELLTVEQTEALIGVIDEAVQNARKHANSQHIVISVKSRDDKIFARITDDGRGFDPHHIVPGYGLRSMRERIKNLGGTFAIKSRPHRGTIIHLSFPIAEGDR